MKTEIIKILLDAAQQAGIAGEILVALCSVESSLNPKALNKYDGGSPSYGLCQVKVETARRFDKTVTPEKLLQAKYNARIAAKELARQIDRYDGNLILGLAAYNAGKVKYEESGRLKNRHYVGKVLNTHNGVILGRHLYKSATKANSLKGIRFSNKIRNGGLH